MILSKLVTTILLSCHSGDPNVATQIEREAVTQRVDPALALAVGVLESGLQPTNPMGVRACYARYNRDGHHGTAACVRIGVTSLKNRLVAAQGKPNRGQCRRTDDPTVCRALVVYNQGPQMYGYARHALRIVSFVRRKLAPLRT